MTGSMNLLGFYLTVKAPATLPKGANIWYFYRPHCSCWYSFGLLENQICAGSSRPCIQLETVIAVQNPFLTLSRSAGIPWTSSTSTRSQSASVVGAAGIDFLNKLNQALPLTVADIWHLHACLENGDAWDIVFSGTALFCVYARARRSYFIHGMALELTCWNLRAKLHPSTWRCKSIRPDKQLCISSSSWTWLHLAVGYLETTGSGYG